VIGGRNSGVEEGLFLARFAERIRLVEFMPELGASARLPDAVRSDPRFTIHTNTEVVAFLPGPSGKLARVKARDRVTGEELEFRPAAAFEFVGLDPNTAFLEGAVDLDPRGFIVTAGGHETSVPGVFAAGDVRAGSTKQLAAAVGEGVSALLEIRSYLEDRGPVRFAVGGDGRGGRFPRLRLACRAGDRQLPASWVVMVRVQGEGSFELEPVP
jgi:thioredoxin reductase (NADPH)